MRKLRTKAAAFGLVTVLTVGMFGSTAMAANGYRCVNRGTNKTYCTNAAKTVKSQKKVCDGTGSNCKSSTPGICDGSGNGNGTGICDGSGNGSGTQQGNGRGCHR